ncbi:hypothetical protein HOB10_04625 [Candidatus Parcubacteria bacterium]|jgi:uncharacterized membrane protein|nr:hypothetical protein [Candidatus Parcubacteria bacterium]
MEEHKKEVKPDAKDIEANKTIAALAYIGIICFVPLLLKKRSKFAQFHAKQGLLLLIIEVVAWLIPFIGWFLMMIAIIYSVLGIINAMDGKYWKMPYLGKYTAKLNL